MAGPLAGISAQQIAQQKLPDQAAQQAQKSGPSKFDQSMKGQGVDGANKAQHAQAAQQVQQLDKAKQIEQAGKVQKSDMGKADANKTAIKDPVTQKSETRKATSFMGEIISGLERSQGAIDKLINGGLQGKSFSNQEMLQLQAGMYKYSQEMELTSKVVEKATSGLKDTLKTQV